MKKYIAPSVKMVKIDSSAILSGSGFNSTNEKLGSGEYARGHRGPLDWDDDDEE